MRNNLKRYCGQMVNASGIVRAIGHKKGGECSDKVMLLQNVIINNNRGETKIDHLWMALPRNKSIVVGRNFNGVGHIAKYFKKSRNGNKQYSMDYCLVLH